MLSSKLKNLNRFSQVSMHLIYVQSYLQTYTIKHEKKKTTFLINIFNNVYVTMNDNTRQNNMFNKFIPSAPPFPIHLSYSRAQ